MTTKEIKRVRMQEIEPLTYSLLTKSDFMNHEECPVYLWLIKNRPDLLPLDLEKLQRFQTGLEIDKVSRKLFPGGVEVNAFNETGWENTKKLIRLGERILYQPTAVTSEGLSAKADILIKNNEGSWDLYEVKQTASVKEEHIKDVSFQRIAFEDAGVPIGKTFLVHVNTKYIRGEQINPQELFVIKDITADVQKAKAEVRVRIRHAKDIVDRIATPDELLLHKCTDPGRCKYIEFYVHGFPEIYSIADRISGPHLKALLDRGILNPDRLDQRLLDRAGYVREIPFREINTEGIARELSKLTYPLYFLDYETFNHPLPPFEGTHPHQNIPFQYSLHIQAEKGGPVVHKEFIFEEFENPVPALLKQLKEDFGNSGSVVVWNQSFEKTRNREMAVAHPELSEFLEGINSRMFDLMNIFKFKTKLYTQTEFGRSSSLKKVLPVLIPHLSYDSLAIKDGETASASWKIMTDKKLGKRVRQKLKKDMLLYCGRDTEAMVAILEHLYSHLG